MLNWFATVLRKPPAPKRPPLPCEIDVQLSDGQLTILNYLEGTASEIEVLVDGQPAGAPQTLLGGFQTTVALDGKPASVVVRWVDEFGQAGEWHYNSNSSKTSAAKNAIST